MDEDTFPTRVVFTFNQAGNASHSRIGRIYVTQPILDTAQEWNIEPYGIPGADHDRVLVVVVDTDAPNTSKGRRTIPEFPHKDKIFMEKVAEAGCRAKREADQQPDNIQWIWKHCKDNVMKMATAREKQIVPKLMVESKELKKDIEQATKKQTEDKQAKGLELSNLRQHLRNTIEKQHMKRRKATSQKYRACKETMTKEFAGRGKKTKTKDPIYALR
jgi:hypothetical protein